MRSRTIERQECDDVIAFLTNSTIPEVWNTDRTKRQTFRRKCAQYIIHDGKLCIVENKKIKEIITADDEEKILMILERYHNDGHRGRDTTFDKIRQEYYGITRERVEDHVSRCSSCMRFEPLKINEELKVIIPQFPWERVQIDLIDLSEFESLNEGYRYIINAIDCFSKFIFNSASKVKTAEAVYEFLNKLFIQEGSPYVLHSDNGLEFKNSRIADLCNVKKIKIVHGRPRHPMSQGQIERANQTINRSIQKSCFKSKKVEKCSRIYHTFI